MSSDSEKGMFTFCLHACACVYIVVAPCVQVDHLASVCTYV